MRNLPELSSFTGPELQAEARTIYDGMFHERIKDAPELTQEGATLQQEAHSHIPSGYELYGTWPKDLLHLGVAARDDVRVLACTVYDNEGTALPGYVYLAIQVPAPTEL